MSDNSTHDDELDSLPQLTDKQYKFVEGKLKGLSNTQAYKDAYDTSNQSQTSIWRLAAKVASNVKVMSWIEFHKAEAVRKLVDETSYTLQAHLDELNDAIEYAKQCKSAPTVYNAIVSKGKACNHYTEHKEININNKSDISLLDRIGKEFGLAARDEAARNMGYKPEELRKHLDS